MNRNMLTVAALLLAIVTTPTHAGLVNPGFETSDLTGWTASPSSKVSVVSSAAMLDEVGTYAPAEGSYFAYLKAGAGTDVYTTLSQSFSALAGDTLSFNIFFDAGDRLPGNDDGYAKLIDPSSGSTILYSKDVAAVGAYGHTSWSLVVATLKTTGTYTLEIGVRNVGDNFGSSAVGVDGAGINHPTPEPTSLTLAAISGVSMLAFGWRRRKTATA